jgi:hypothetical protein
LYRYTAALGGGDGVEEKAPVLRALGRVATRYIKAGRCTLTPPDP